MGQLLYSVNIEDYKNAQMLKEDKNSLDVAISN